jgi:TolA-binding protein
VSGGEIALRAGQRLVVDLPQGETVISEPKPDEWLDGPAGTGAQHAEPPADASDRPRATGGKPGAGRFDGDRRWAGALAAGQLDRILAEAERAGLKATLDKAPSDDLLALADAARYRRRMDLARDALLAVRRRFPDTPRSLDAAFLLGRVEEASDRGVDRAIEWYDEYLTRAPKGTYASEALGRKMTLMSKQGGSAGARPVAEEYLRRFPAGTYAGAARAFVRAP